MSNRHWLFSSSGARKLYIENVVRSLALRRRDKIQFRYEKAIVSPNFEESFRKGTLVGDTAYLTYLDNRDPSQVWEFVPNREATIASVVLRGTSYIITLQVGGFFDHREVDDLQKFVQELAREDLPRSDSNEAGYAGYWAVEVDPIPSQFVVPYSYKGNHLSAFESCVEQCMLKTDFSDGRYMFASILDTRAASNACNYDVTLKAGKSYTTRLYVYKKDHSAESKHYNYSLRVSSECEEIKFLSSKNIAIEAEYDELNVTYKVAPEIDLKRVSLTYTLVDQSDEQSEFVCFAADLGYLVEPVAFQSWFRVTIATIGIAAPQLIRLTGLGIYEKAAIVLFGAFGAAAAILYKKK